MSTDPDSSGEIMARAYRSGAPWLAQEDDELVAGLRAGSTVEALADALGRGESAISGRLARMAPRDDENVPKSRSGRVEWLRERLAAEPGYDWRTPLITALGSYQRPWSEREDAAVRDGWAYRRPLAELAAEFGVEDHVMVRRLVQLGLAEGVVDATDRLAFVPDGVVAARRALALDAVRTRVLVLALVADGDLVHLSLHAREEDAEAVRDRVVAELRETRRRITITWTLASRQVEDTAPSTGKTRKGRVVVHGDREEQDTS